MGTDRSAMRRGVACVLLITGSAACGGAVRHAEGGTGQASASATSHVVAGDGVTIALPDPWIGGPHAAELPTPLTEWADTALKGYDDDFTVLYAFGANAILVILRLDLDSPITLRDASDKWEETFAENGFTEISREPATVAGLPASNMVSTAPGTPSTLATTSDEYVFVDDTTIWVVAWSSLPQDFDQNVPTFRDATATLSLTPAA